MINTVTYNIATLLMREHGSVDAKVIHLRLLGSQMSDSSSNVLL